MIASVQELMDKVSKSNILGRKYYNLAKVNFKSYLHFVVELMNNPTKVIALMEPSVKEQLAADIEEIVFPRDVENYILVNYQRYIFKIFNNEFRRKFFANDVSEEDAVSYAQESLRRAIWGYTKVEIKFSTYSYKAIYSGFNDLYKINCRRSRRNKEYTSTINKDKDFSCEDDNWDLTGDLSYREFRAEKHKDKNELTINDIVTEVCKNSFELEMVDIWKVGKRDNSDWIPACQLAYQKHYGKPITEAGIREKFRRLKERIAIYVKDNNIRVIDILPE